ncbi:MAG: alpha/beta hydrolase [Usitatibacter sp.]
MKKLLAAAAAVVAFGLQSCAHAPSESSVQAIQPLAMEEFMVPSDPGIEIYVRNKHPAGVSQYSSSKVVLYVHGATYPAETAFDLRLDGVSWMEWIAQRGYDVYLVNLRGYSRSTKPREMSEPPEKNPPPGRVDQGVRDVAAAVEFIRKRRGVDKVNLIGWSWGTSVMGKYTTLNNDTVEKLVLYAPQWLRTTASLVQSGGATTPAYRTVTKTAARDRWLTGVPADKKATLIPPGWYEAWEEATFDTDQKGPQPGSLRAPNGVVADGAEFWSAQKPLYDPGLIRVPTFLVHAEWDADLPSYMAQQYFGKLTNVPYKAFLEIGEGTHTVIMEKNRMQLFQGVQAFLDGQQKP